MLRILHISDTHGLLPEPQGDFDVVVHSGDFLPNYSAGIRHLEVCTQKNWLEDNAPRFSPHYWTKPFLVCPGNHDYIDVVPTLRGLGIDARSINECIDTIDGVTFLGFPWTPEFCGWNWMCGREDMARRLKLVENFLNGTDVLVTHGPSYGILDRNRDGDRCGCPELRRVLQDTKHPPKLHLHGHIHESAGLLTLPNGITVSNAACTQRILTL